MANSRKPGPLNPSMDWCQIPALTNGPLGFFDQGDPNVTTLLGDTPGPLGFNDANDPSVGPFGSAMNQVMFLSEESFDRPLEIDFVEDRVAASVSAKPLSSAWARTEPSRAPSWKPAASDRVMGNLLANSERLADNKSAPGMWDRITEKGRAVLDATGEAVDDMGRAFRRAVTIDSPEEARARADAIDLRRTRNQVAADLRAHRWGDNGLVCMRLGPAAMAIQPASVNPAYHDSFDQRIARSTNEALELYAGGALIDAVAIPILTAGGKLVFRFLSEETKLSYGLRLELRSSLNADPRQPAKISGLSQTGGANKAANVVRPTGAKNAVVADGAAVESKPIAAMRNAEPMAYAESTAAAEQAAIRTRVLENIADSQAARASSQFEQLDRYEKAYNYYAQAGFSADRALGHLDGIDFAYPVSLTELTPGTNYTQHVLGGKVGNYFSPVGTPAEAIGINPTGRIPVLFAPSQPLSTLQSTAADILDTWTVPSAPYQTQGGGIQLFVPNNQLMIQVTKP